VAKVTVAYPRTIYVQGQNTIAIFSFISSISIFIFGLIIITLFETLLLRRLLKLSTEVDSISVKNLENTRIKEGANDELGKLSRTINHLLDEIARAQKKEHDAAQLEMVANEKLKRSLQAAENMNKLMVGRELKMAELKEKLAALEQNKL
jgi:signal transduction histidine kinase